MKPTKYETDAAQNAKEIAWLADIIKREKVTSFLEVGARYGGSVWKIAQVLPAGSRIVVVDMPGGYGGRTDGQVNLEACIDRLNEMGFDATLILGDSTDPEVVKQVQALGPFGACFIDANHVEYCVRSDWENYGEASGIVAFHDIGWKRDAHYRGVRIDVPLVWAELKAKHRHEEIIVDQKGKDNGIGVLWRD